MLMGNFDSFLDNFNIDVMLEFFADTAQLCYVTLHLSNKMILNIDNNVHHKPLMKLSN